MRSFARLLVSVARAVVNLDAANEQLQCECAVDVKDLVCIEDVMAELGLGPVW